MTELNGIVFERTVLKYAELDSQEKALKKAKEPLNKAIKEQMKADNKEKFEIDGVKVSFQIQERATMNEDRLLLKLKSLGLNEAIKTVEKPNEEVIQNLIYEGKLSPSELEACMERKFVEVLKVSGGKK